MIDVNSLNNRKIIGRLTSPNNGFGTAEPESRKMADSWFEMLNEEETAELLNDKDSKNTQKACKDRNFIYFQVSRVSIKICSKLLQLCNLLHKFNSIK